ncbi:MAG TPA: acetyl-CoA carboxylase, carboxyltransferase subunit beta [Verrucomicrobiae bacterium]|nr:acetyl-CoA carboxylase, carboxyltransferase subunit beta [Verrucomicrobiae bacterium]
MIQVFMDTTSFTKKSFVAQNVEPALTPHKQSPAALPKKPKLGAAKSKTKKREIPEGLWVKCPNCEEMIFDKELDENLKVCSKCQHHFPIGSRERIHSMVETCTFEEMDAEMASVDILGFKGVATYTSKLEAYKKNTTLKDAVVTGLGKIGTHRVALGVMDFGFLGGSMGSVVGEKLTRLIERGTEKELPVIIISTSGGARMYEGMFSLMQMAKTSAALAYHAQKRLPYISVLTHPTTAGVMASYASLGDLILAEPKAMIGFAGPRVIKDTTQAELPPGFQTAEFLLDHGLIDSIVSRKEMKSQLIKYLDFMTAAKKAAAAA